MSERVSVYTAQPVYPGQWAWTCDCESWDMPYDTAGEACDGARDHLRIFHERPQLTRAEAQQREAS